MPRGVPNGTARVFRIEKGCHPAAILNALAREAMKYEPPHDHKGWRGATRWSKFMKEIS